MKINVKDSNLICGRSHIDGVWIDADSGETLDVINPATGDTISKVAKCGTSAVSYTHLRAHETDSYLVCRLLLEKKK